jgi:hypothetical protein
MRIPLFPLHTVLTPGLALPLHVFEERYRVMVRRCLDTASPFGVVLILEGSEVAPAGGSPQELAIASVGTLAEIREASRFADGRWKLLVVGTGRFAIHEVYAEAEPYLVGEVVPLDDAPGEADAAEALVGRVARRFVDYLRLLQPRDDESVEPITVKVEVDVEAGAYDDGGATDEPAGFAGATAGLRIPDDPSELSFLLAGVLQVEPGRKQALLEAATAEDRLRALDGLLDRELVLLRQRLGPGAVDRATLVDRAN